MFPVLGCTLLCDPEPDTCPLWAPVSQCLERGLDEIVLEASFSLCCAVFTVISLTLPGTTGDMTYA